MLGAMDIGTNSVRLLVVDEKNPLCPLLREIRTTRIGADVHKKGLLQEAACARTLTALGELQKIVLSYGVQKLPIVATSAVRDAQNRDCFLKSVQDALALEIEVIEGEREAHLTYLGVTADLPCQQESTLIFDLGGGSTELVVGQGSRICSLRSLDVGAVRVTEAFFKKHPAQSEDCQRVKEFTQNLLQPYLAEYQNVNRVVGVGGTATSLAAIQQKMLVYEAKKVHHSLLQLEEIQQIRMRMEQASLAELKTWPGLQPKRADIILGGVLIIETLLTCLNKENFIVSEHDLLLGLILEQIH